MAEKKGVKCPECRKTLRSEDALTDHIEENHMAPEVDDSFYDDKSTTITLIP